MFQWENGKSELNPIEKTTLKGLLLLKLESELEHRERIVFKLEDLKKVTDGMTTQNLQEGIRRLKERNFKLVNEDLGFEVNSNLVTRSGTMGVFNPQQEKLDESMWVELNMDAISHLESESLF